ncbi:MAG TPA: glycosyltransferase family 2 protein [Thermoanaerobaculia bacterium]|nr:glycosyltransferase family 2 protein [Thermoanaerobaculia bacterium]
MSIDISIIIPVYNRPAKVGETVTSVLRQAHDCTMEVLVIDDASTDDTWQVVQSMAGIRPLQMPQNGGQCAARNLGLAHATGRYVKFLDSDDVLLDGHLQRELALARETNADIVASGWREVDVDGHAIERRPPHFSSNIVDDLLAGRSVPTSAALYVRHSELRWDPAVRILDDWDCFVQAALRAEKIVTLDTPAYDWRDHSGPRLTDATMILNARSHHQVLHKMEDVLRTRGLLTDARRKRLAQYFYKELRVLSLHDRAAFDAALAHIFELDPHFHPVDEERQWWMRLAARVIGTRNTVLGHTAIKRLLKG